MVDPVRFWSFVKNCGAEPDDCWEWDGARTKAGYGQIRDSGVRRALYAHRVAYELEVEPIPEGRFLCHRCDNPACVNPRHLFVGTQTDNMRDAARKGRAGAPYETRAKGERQHLAKLTEEIVLDIRHRYARGESGTKIAEHLGVQWSTVYRVIQRKTWAHV